MEFIQQNILLILLALGSGGGLIYLSLKGGGGGGLTPTQVTLLVNREDAQIVDLRSAEEYAAGHIPDSRHIPLAELEQRAGELEKFKDSPIVLVCQNGGRAAGACRQLAKLGFARAGNLAGGFAGWRAAGLPMRKGNKK